MNKHPHLEYSDVNVAAGCTWEHPYTDYDGTHASAPCTNVPEVLLVFWDGWEWLAYEFCRPHGNLALIDERRSAMDYENGRRR